MRGQADALTLDAFARLVAESARAKQNKIDWGSMTLEELCGSRDLGQIPLSPAQSALCRAADGRPHGLDRDRALFHFGASQFEQTERPRVVIVESGVRGGKSLIGAMGALLLSAMTCAFRRPPEHPDEVPGPDGMVGVRDGELVRALVVAPLLKAGRQALHHLVGTIVASPKLRSLVVGEPGTESVRLRRPDGATVLVELVAASSGGLNLRSTWLAGILFDEADFHDPAESAVNLLENYRAIVPRVLPGGQIWLVSSPYDDTSEFHKLFKEHFGKPGRALSFHSDSLSMNPSIDRAEIEAERRRDPENAAREYDAVPLTSSTTRWFSPASIAACCVRQQTHLPPNGAPHWAGADLGFRKNSSALALSRYESRNGRGMAVLAMYNELIPQPGSPLKPSEVVKAFAEDCFRYGATSIRADQWSEDSAREHIAALRGPRGQALSYDVVYTQQVNDMFTEARRRMNEGLVELPNDPRLIRQLEAVRMKRAANGQIVPILPAQGAAHCDVLMAVILSICQVSMVPPQPRHRFSPPAGFVP